MKRDQKFTAISIYLVTLFVFLPGLVFSQGNPVIQDKTKSDTLEREKKPGDEIILGPVVDPYLYYDPYGEAYRVQNGLLLGSGLLGVETSYRHPGSPYYLSLTMGAISRSANVSTSDRAFLMSGFSLGREFMLNEAVRLSDETKTKFYMRIGPGIGLAGRGIFDGDEMNYYLGVTTSAILGAQFNLSRRTAFFVDGGGRILWFPALNDIGFMGIPAVSFGLQFSISPEVPMVRY